MVKLHFNYKDIFRAGRLGFSAKKIWTGFVGLLLGLLTYDLFAFVACLVSPDWNLSEIWQTYRLAPNPFTSELSLSPSGWILLGIGKILFLVILLLTTTAISKITIEQLRGDEFYESREAMKFALQNWKGVLLSPLTLLLFILILLSGGVLMGLIGRIPYLGSLFLGLFAIPFIGAGIFVAYLIAVFFVSFAMAPPIVATTKSDTFDTLFEVFSVANDQPWRLLLWKGLLIPVAFLGVFLLAFFVNLGLSITQFALTPFFLGKGSLSLVWQNGLASLPRIPYTINLIDKSVELFAPSLFTPQPFQPVNWAGLIGSFLFGITFYFVTLFVFAYGFAILASGDTLIYTVLTKIKDDKNLLEVTESAEEEKEPFSEEPRKEEEKKETEESK